MFRIIVTTNGSRLSDIAHDIEMIEKTSEGVGLDVWMLHTVLASTWPFYLDGVYQSVEKLPDSLSLSGKAARHQEPGP